MMDPTYIKDLINENPEWELAFSLSEHLNDNAPIGWSDYIPYARAVLVSYEIKRKE